MSQQLGIMLMIDVEAALKANTLEDNIYMYDNMKQQGSEGQGTGALVSAIHGTYWNDGSQANEQVLNWLLQGIGSVPPTIPKNFQANRSHTVDLNVLLELEKLSKIRQSETDSSNNEVHQILKKRGLKTKRQGKAGNAAQTMLKIMDVTGEFLTEYDEKTSTGMSHLTPQLKNITGEAVDKEVIYPAEYGSPDLETDGWYWSASVNTYIPGTYAYTMHIQLNKLAQVDNEWVWVPVDMTCQAYIKISNEPKRNGFTHGGVGKLPIM